MKDPATPEPHYIPGYTGYCPQYIYRCGETYGSLSHKILLDPTIHKSYQLVLSNRTLTDFQVVRKDENNPNVVELRNYNNNSIFRHPITPGYSGSLPRSKSALGKTFTVGAEEGLMEFEIQTINKKKALNAVYSQVSANNGDYNPTVDEKAQNLARYKLPLLEARPEYNNILRNTMVTESPEPIDKGVSPYFKSVTSPDKKFKSGFTGHVPFGYSKYGQGYAPLSNSGLCDFTNYYHTRKSNEWTPVNIIQSEPPLVVSSNEIYHKHIGMVPNYTGHVPGNIFRSGRTFGADSRDAKRWLKGDFSE
ncbi:CIMIP2 protein CG18335 [Halyomorpha halys]|uniref:CIMIP2 protein CG18335 n=1 Tax=Halyomorpha halys TaxID=286706 RepID=UPI0006D4DFD6|nr:UPF0605 protein CG18335-like [Halyomorpha halys]